MYPLHKKIGLQVGLTLEQYIAKDLIHLLVLIH
jgi:hypothetical protein